MTPTKFLGLRHCSPFHLAHSSLPFTNAVRLSHAAWAVACAKKNKSRVLSNRTLKRNVQNVSLKLYTFLHFYSRVTVLLFDFPSENGIQIQRERDLQAASGGSRFQPHPTGVPGWQTGVMVSFFYELMRDVNMSRLTRLFGSHGIKTHPAGKLNQTAGAPMCFFGRGWQLRGNFCEFLSCLQ